MGTLGNEQQELVLGNIICGRYRVERFLGRGGMGAVYAVQHVNTGETLALKVLHPVLAQSTQSVERFRTEARAPVRIGTDNVVRIIDADVSPELGGVPVLVMELLTGRDLDTELRRRGALPAGEVVLYLRQVARALDKAHGMGIIHRDLKPANLYLTHRDDGTPLVKILDFGIAKLADSVSTDLTQDGAIFGTPWYMSPEQARGQAAKAGPSVDRWALGLIAFRLLTGRNYWSADGMAALIGQILYEPMVPPSHLAPHLGPRFDAWFAKACNREVELRFGSSTDQIKSLAEALGVSPFAPSSGPADISQPPHGFSTGQHTPPPHTPVFGAPPLASASSLAPPTATPGHSTAQPLPHVPQGAQSLPASPIAPGTFPPGSTGAPLASTQAPFPPVPKAVKSSNALSIALGILIAVLVAGLLATAWIVLSHKSPNTAAAPLPPPTMAPASPPQAATFAAPTPSARPSAEEVAPGAPSASSAPSAGQEPGVIDLEGTAPAKAPSAPSAFPGTPPAIGLASPSGVASAAPFPSTFAGGIGQPRPALPASASASAKLPPKTAPKVGRIQF